MRGKKFWTSLRMCVRKTMWLFHERSREKNVTANIKNQGTINLKKKNKTKCIKDYIEITLIDEGIVIVRLKRIVLSAHNQKYEKDQRSQISRSNVIFLSSDICEELSLCEIRRVNKCRCISIEWKGGKMTDRPLMKSRKKLSGKK